MAGPAAALLRAGTPLRRENRMNSAGRRSRRFGPCASTNAGWKAVHGVDNNMRREFFGRHGVDLDTERLLRERAGSSITASTSATATASSLFAEQRFDLVFHCAAQPSHDLAASRPFDDFEVNALATLNLLEAARAHCPETPFVFMSTNKVYGDAPNELPLVELMLGLRRRARRDRRDDAHRRLDALALRRLEGRRRRDGAGVRSLFGLPTVCFRGGASPGLHSAAELHGFLAYIARAIREAHVPDLRLRRQAGARQHPCARRLHRDDGYAEARRGIYNLGGGRANSISVLEAIAAFEVLIGERLATESVDEPRRGDHTCYISDLSRLRADYPAWEVTVSLEQILEELAREGAPALS